jgi:HK97 family phage prohead protease
MGANNGSEREIRYFTLKELRVAEGEKAGDPPVLDGYAAVFNMLSEDLGGFREVIHPGAFKKTLDEADIRALINHDPNMVLGRNKAGTLELAEDIHGLRIHNTPPDNSYARDLLNSVKRGDIDQMSFAFETVRDEWKIVNDGDKEIVTRSLIEVRLFDVSIVTYPAYPQTTVMVRSKAAELTKKAAPVQADHPATGEASEQGLDLLRRRIQLEREF